MCAAAARKPGRRLTASGRRAPHVNALDRSGGSVVRCGHDERGQRGIGGLLLLQERLPLPDRVRGAQDIVRLAREAIQLLVAAVLPQQEGVLGLQRAVVAPRRLQLSVQLLAGGLLPIQ